MLEIKSCRQGQLRTGATLASEPGARSHVVTVRPAKNVLGSVAFPGDKSISHRYGMLAALASGNSRFKNFSTGADCASTLRCMEVLGVLVWCVAVGSFVVSGSGGALHAPAHPLDCGNSGSTMRMLSGFLAAQSFASELTGDASLSRRPMRR